MADQSFFVHLQTLLDFAQELQTQLGGLGTPIDKLNALSDTPVRLGAFGEAQSLTTSHQAAIVEMSDLLGQVQQAISFAEDITKTVATGYQQADQDAAGSMQVSTGYVGAAAGADTSGGQSSGQSSGQESIWDAIFGSNGGQQNSGGQSYSDPSNSQGGWT